MTSCTENDYAPIVKQTIKFIESLKCPDGSYGPSAGAQFKLRPFQREMLNAVYGDLDEKGLRRTRQAIFSAPRKSGKTAAVSGLCLAHLCGPLAIKNGQLYSLSIDREQAGILFKYAAAMVYMNPALKKRLIVRESRKQIVDPISGSVYTVLSGERRGKMGKSSSVLFFDELAEFGSDRELYDALMTSRSAHEEPLAWVFSTQAPDDKALLSELIDYGLEIKAGNVVDQTFKLFLYSAPMEADPWDEKVWYACNPALGDFKNPDIMRDDAKTAKIMPSAEGAFRNLQLNQRVSAGVELITKSMWDANAGEIDEDVFTDNPVVGGLDLSQKNDLSTLILVAKDKETQKRHVKSFFWVAEDGLEEKSRQDKAKYPLWRDQGYLEAVPGPVINYRWIAWKIAEVHDEYHLDYVVFDRWKINTLIPYLDEEGIPYALATWETDEKTKVKKLCIPECEANSIIFVPHGQGFRDMDPALNVLLDTLMVKDLIHGDNPVLTMCAANVKAESDPAGNRKFDKKRSRGRIDGIVGLSMALYGLENLPSISREAGASDFFLKHSFF